MKYGSRDIERKRFVDTLAVRYKSSGDALQRERHVAKRKQRNKDLEIIFDPESHKYVFHMEELSDFFPNRYVKWVWHGAWLCIYIRQWVIA